MNDPFKCYVVRRNEPDGDSVTTGLEDWSLQDLPDKEILIRTEFTSLNYKDAMACSGHVGVVSQFPHVPGIDAAGKVVSSSSDDFQNGDKVMVFHADFGTRSFGGFSQYVRVPSSWVYRIPANLTPEQSMAFGTAGFTAAMSVSELERHNVLPADGPIVVSGATGGVGSVAVQMLATRGFSVSAITGKPERADWLRQIGAQEVLSRDEFQQSPKRPLSKARWNGAIDTVGGSMLENILAGTKPHGCVTACGLVAGHKLELTVYPFILRGVTLQGIDSANIGYERRQQIWHDLANDYQDLDLASSCKVVKLDEVQPEVQKILAGQITGRTIVDCR